jgi:hypothetical protein
MAQGTASQSQQVRADRRQPRMRSLPLFIRHNPQFGLRGPDPCRLGPFALVRTPPVIPLLGAIPDDFA